MDDVQTGHEHHRPRGSVVTLNDPLVDRLSPQQRGELVTTLVDLAGSSLQEQERVERLGAHLEALGVPQPPIVVARLVETLAGATDLTVVTDSGQVLHGDPSFDITRQDTGVEGTEDPEHGDRPTYS